MLIGINQVDTNEIKVSFGPDGLYRYNIYICTLSSQVAMRELRKRICAIYLRWPYRPADFEWGGERPVKYYCFDFQCTAVYTSTCMRNSKLTIG